MESKYYALSESMKNTLMIKNLLERAITKKEWSKILDMLTLSYHLFKHHLDKKDVVLEFIPASKNKLMD